MSINKTLIAAALIVVASIVAITFRASYEARIQAEAAHAAMLMQEQEAKETLVRKSIPAFVRSARLAVNEKQFEDALAQVNVALEYEPTQADALLLKAQLLIAKKEFAAASEELDKYGKLRPDDATAKKLAELSRNARPGDAMTLLALAEVLQQQEMFTLADQMVRLAEQGRK